MTRFRVAEAYLRRGDPVLSNVIRAVGPCSLARSRNHFLTLVEAIVWQQLSWRAARAIYDRLLSVMGTRRPRPSDILATSREDLLAAGLSRQKSLYLRDLSVFFEEKRLPRRRIDSLSDEEIIALLTEIKGVGRWTAEMFLIFGLNREDVFPFGDLGLRKAIGHHYNTPEFNDRAKLETITEPWRPYRTIAAWYLWRSGDGTLLGEGT
jgi:DNA-3-methyladenine glycosylase II